MRLELSALRRPPAKLRAEHCHPSQAEAQQLLYPPPDAPCSRCFGHAHLSLSRLVCSEGMRGSIARLSLGQRTSLWSG